MLISSFPEEIIYNCLGFSGADNLVQYREVCMQWKNLIDKTNVVFQKLEIESYIDQYPKNLIRAFGRAKLEKDHCTKLTDELIEKTGKQVILKFRCLCGIKDIKDLFEVRADSLTSDFTRGVTQNNYPFLLIKKHEFVGGEGLDIEVLHQKNVRIELKRSSEEWKCTTLGALSQEATCAESTNEYYDTLATLFKSGEVILKNAYGFEKVVLASYLQEEEENDTPLRSEEGSRSLIGRAKNSAKKSCSKILNILNK